MKNAIVTGANGFIGSWLCRELTDNDVHVTAIIRNLKSDISKIKDLPNLRIIYCELEDILSLPKKIEDKESELFFHLAWEGAGGKYRSDYSLQLMNIKYTCDCVRAAKALGCRKFLATGTITEKIAEDVLNTRLKAENSIYGICKHTAHCILDVLCRNLEIEYVWMRLSNIFGPYSVNGNIVGYTIAEFIKGNIPEFSNADQYYDLLYIEDLVKAICLIAKSNNTKSCYYIGSGNASLLKDYLIKIRNAYGKGCNIRLGARPDDGLRYCKEWFSIDDLVKDVGFQCKYSFEDGIHKTVKWLEENTNYAF